MMTRTIVVASSVLVTSLSALAQDADMPAPDPVASIVGSWSNQREGREAPAAVHITPVTLEGADNAYYVEYTDADALNEIDRQEIWRAYQTDNGWRLRVLGFHYEQYARLRYGGLWVGDGLLPDVRRVEVFPRLDMDITVDGSGFTAATPHPYPVSDGDAMEIKVDITATPDSLEWNATLYAADGTVTNEDEGDELAFHPYDPPVTVEQRDNGLVIIDLKQGDGKRAENGDTVEMHYTGWNTNYQVFDSSRRPRPNAPEGKTYPVTLPGNVIQGWNEGLLGIQEGTVRRLIIPGAMAYGPSGRQPYIRPNETLHFETECVSLTPAGEGDQ